MPLGDLATGMVAALAKFASRFFVDLVFEIAFKGTGYFILARLGGARHGDPDPDGLAVAVIGVLFWTLVGFGAFEIYQVVSSAGDGGS